MNPYRILLVDDDGFFLKVYGDFLRGKGFEVETASSADQALELFAKGKYRLIIVDLVMPGIGGIELIERVRTEDALQDVVVVTGDEDVRTAVRAMRLGVYDYLVKPVEPEELVHVIDRLHERSTLYDEHARLLSENIEYAEIQRIFLRALRIMQSLDLETVCERLLETLSDVSGAQGAALWLAGNDGNELSMHGYRGLVEAGTLPIAWDPTTIAVARELTAGIPVPTRRELSDIAVANLPSPALLVPLVRESKIIGVVQLVDKLGGGFVARDVGHAKILADAAATAIAHARRFRHLERVGLRDPSTSAYNMTYFVDYLGRELQKARRYQRSFSLVQVAIDNLESLKGSLTIEQVRAVQHRLVTTIAQSLSDIDVLARVNDDAMYLLLPEADFLRGLSFVRQARDAIAKNAFLADMEKIHPIRVSFGPATFPRDGDDVDQLFAATNRRLGESRRSSFRKLHLEDLDFWAVADVLIGPPAPYAGEDVQPNRVMEMSADERGLSRHVLLPAGALADLRRSVFSEATRQGRLHGWLYLGGSFESPSDLKGLSKLARGSGALKTYVLGNTRIPDLEGSANLTHVQVPNDAFARYEVALLLLEHAAYGLVAKRRDDGRVYGFHTADWTLVEALIDKLQDAYHLQKG
ncbi:MAG: response regulator [Clostridia bacterium]|nr:response regulator [Deltaproteobacteria bacterium]